MSDKKIIDLEALKRYDQQIKDFISLKIDDAVAQGGVGNPVKLVWIAVNPSYNIEECPISGEFCFYSTQTFTSFTQMCQFFEVYCNYISHQSYPVHFSGEIMGASDYICANSVMIIDDLLYIDGNELSISEIQGWLDQHPSEFEVRYFDI